MDSNLNNDRNRDSRNNYNAVRLLGSFGVLKRGLVYPGKILQQAPNQADTRESSELTKNKIPNNETQTIKWYFWKLEAEKKLIKF